MPAISAPRRSRLEEELTAIFRARFAAPLAEHGIEVADAARELFVRTAMAQAEDGIVGEDDLVQALDRIEMGGLADFYLLKFGPRRLGYNRMVRLLGDMHDKWVALRHRPA